MKTAQITYYGEGPLNLQMRRFKPGKSVRARLDDILPDERRRYWDRFLVVGPDGLIINIGSMVPEKVAREAIGENPQVLGVKGFSLTLPPGFGLDNRGAEPRIVSAAVLAAEINNSEVLEPKPLSDIVEDAGTEASPSRHDGSDKDSGLEILKDEEPTGPPIPIIFNQEDVDGQQDESDTGGGGEEDSLQPGEKDNKEPNGKGAEDAPGGSGEGSDPDGKGAGSEEGDGDPSGEDIVVIRKVTPPVPVDDINALVTIEDDKVTVKPVVESIGAGFGNVEGIETMSINKESTGPTLSDTPVVATKKKKKAAKKKAKKSEADDLMEMF